ncbi:hypothetical protein [Desulfonema magnum]|uniref:hypothetical protein n=1 Tax=Desulfonema magnum TaxID=45655 RepID=UPI001A9B1F4A|nr:hypothetical protein [Desulfonema magnum]
MPEGSILYLTICYYQSHEGFRYPKKVMKASVAFFCWSKKITKVTKASVTQKGDEGIRGFFVGRKKITKATKVFIAQNGDKGIRGFF